MFYHACVILFEIEKIYGLSACPGGLLCALYGRRSQDRPIAYAGATRQARDLGHDFFFLNTVRSVNSRSN